MRSDEPPGAKVRHRRWSCGERFVLWRRERAVFSRSLPVSYRSRMWQPGEHCANRSCIARNLADANSAFAATLMPISRLWSNASASQLCRPNFFEHALEILSSRDAQGFAIDAPEQPQAESAQAMPVFRFGKQRLHPHFAFAHGLLIGFRLMVPPDSFEVAGMEPAMHLTTLITGGTLCFEGTGIAGGRVGTVLGLLPRILHLGEVQQVASWADRVVMLGIIGKLCGSAHRGADVPHPAEEHRRGCRRLPGR